MNQEDNDASSSDEAAFRVGAMAWKKKKNK